MYEMKVRNYLKVFSENFKPTFRQNIIVGDNSLQRLIDFSLIAHGIHERPFLFKLSCETVGGKYQDYIFCATALEIFHWSTLIIDDILDDSPSRCGVLSVNSNYGSKMAILVGEMLENLAYKSFDKCIAENRLNELQIKTVYEVFNNIKFQLYLGQFLDLTYENNLDVEENKYYDLIEKTTGSLIEGCTKLGAIFGEGSEIEIDCLAKYGVAIGKAMQIRDDIIDIIGDSDVIGKIIGGDIIQRKMRLPLIKTLERCNEKEKKYISKIISNGIHKSNELEKTIKIIVNSGAIEYSKEMITKYTNEATGFLRSLKNSESKDNLVSFAELINSSW